MAMHPAKLRYLRRWYFAALLGALVLLLVVRFFVVGEVTPGTASPLRSVSAQVLESLIAATVAGAFIAVLLVWLLPADDRVPESDVVQAREIEPLIRAEAAAAREWRVRARTASYFRSRTLPWLAEATVARNVSITVRAQLMDPNDERLLHTYIRYLNTREGAARKWDVDRVRHEILATVMSVYAWREAFPRLDIEIGLSPTFWIMSLDMSQRVAVVTGQYKGHPALGHRDGTAFYNAHRDEFDAGMAGCRVLDPAVRAPKPEDLDTESVKATLTALGLDHSGITEEGFATIGHYIRRPEHRYE
ncbi:hypothetical protein [Actinokineospora globicatena]|uniref:Uncharacterized protein n=1 Tax=Actinokineospora globicatena TaxID=103729 RepID=A0A9W6QG35_9PSEU|nr:hypothetical protein [Actinokineospora globicatena]GLW89798.1 hypothetical protein Aglo03_06140 [Actinokineospora globicatena]